MQITSLGYNSGYSNQKTQKNNQPSFGTQGATLKKYLIENAALISGRFPAQEKLSLSRLLVDIDRNTAGTVELIRDSIILRDGNRSLSKTDGSLVEKLQYAKTKLYELLGHKEEASHLESDKVKLEAAKKALKDFDEASVEKLASGEGLNGSEQDALAALEKSDKDRGALCDSIRDADAELRQSTRDQKAVESFFPGTLSPEDIDAIRNAEEELKAAVKVVKTAQTAETVPATVPASAQA